MLRKRTCAALAAVIVLLPFSLGCDYRGFGIVIAGFDEYQVQGVQLWRRNDQTGQYERAHSIVFDRAATNWPETQAELIGYSNAAGGIEWPVAIERDPADPDLVTLRLYYLRVEEAGLFRATVFNAAGESPLSSEAIDL